MAQDPFTLLAQAKKAAQNAESGFSIFAPAQKRIQQNGVEASRAFEQAAELQKSKLNEPEDMANTVLDAFKAYRKTAPADAARVLSQAIDHYLSQGNFQESGDPEATPGRAF